MTTIEQTLAAEALEQRARELGGDYDVILFHEDGSLTVIVDDPLGNQDTESPRDFDGNVSTLINEHRDYQDMDDPDSRLAEARERWSGRQREHMVNRYVAMFRDDVAVYVDRWDISGYSQGDVKWGWGYVLTEALEGRITTPVTRDEVREMFAAELDVYQQWWRGDVYIGHHLTIGEPQVIYGEAGAYVSGYDVTEETVHGFFGYTSDADRDAAIVWNFTESPVTRKVTL